jgi:hypothetical protein
MSSIECESSSLTVDALYIIPNSSAELGCVHVLSTSECLVGQVVSNTELVVKQKTDVIVESVDQRVAMIVPAVVLDAESVWNIFSAATGKVLICVVGIVNVVADGRRNVDDGLVW